METWLTVKIYMVYFIVKIMNHIYMLSYIENLGKNEGPP